MERVRSLGEMTRKRGTGRASRRGKLPRVGRVLVARTRAHDDPRSSFLSKRRVSQEIFNEKFLQNQTCSSVSALDIFTIKYPICILYLTCTQMPKYVNRIDTITWISLGASTPIEIELTISLNIYVQCRNFAYTAYIVVSFAISVICYV